MSTLGESVKRLRERCGLSLQEVADRSLLSKAHIWEIESGSSVNPTIRSLCCIAIALDVLPDELAAASVTDCLRQLKVGEATHKFVMPSALRSRASKDGGGE